MENRFEVKNDKILRYETGASHNIEHLHVHEQERINKLVTGIHKIIHSCLASMDAGKFLSRTSGIVWLQKVFKIILLRVIWQG